MFKLWKWALNSSLMSWVVWVKVGKGGSLVALRFLPFRAILWTLAYLYYAYGSVMGALDTNTTTESEECYKSALDETYKTYNAKLVSLGQSLIALATNMFCIFRLNLRDIPTLITKSIALHHRIIRALGQGDENLHRKIKCMILYSYVAPFILSVYLSQDCSREPVFSLLFWAQLVFHWLWNLVALPAPAMTTVFFLTLESINQSFSHISRRVNIIVASKCPKIFLEVSPLNYNRFKTKIPLNAKYVYSLRKIHDELVLFTEEVIQFFQADILVFFIMAFYSNVLFNYAIVSNGSQIFHSKEGTKFMCINVVFVVYLMVNLWAICAGPSKIQDQQRDLITSVSRLSTMPGVSKDVMYEIKMLQLQCRNHKSSFEVFGMFKLNLSLLFTMCASITSYIVVLIQFTIDSQSTSGSPDTANSTVASSLNVSKLDN